MEEQFDLIQQIYELVINFAVTYSFQLLGAVIVVGFGFIVGGWVARVLLRIQERRNVDITLRQFIASTVRLVVVALFLIIALSQLGISITPLIAAIGGLAVGASFAIQGPVSNYGAGFIIILTRMYKVGDTISVRGCSGVVSEITLAITVLTAEDGEQIVIPNKHIVGEIHRNSQAHRIYEGQVGVSYQADPEQVISLLKGCLTDIQGVNPQPAPLVGINSFGDSAIVFDYRLWLETARYYELMHQVNLAVYQALTREGIEIPYPQRVLHQT